MRERSLLPGATLLSGPADWQILQQDALGGADCALAGTWRTEAPEHGVEVRAVREADGAVPATTCDWQAATTRPDGTWNHLLRLPRWPLSYRNPGLAAGLPGHQTHAR
jgi:hypothetical protein